MTENDGFSIDQVGYRRMRFDDASADFACSKPDFKKYFKVISTYDQNEQMGQPYVFVWNDHVVGYIVLAMDHLNEKQSRLDIDTCMGLAPAGRQA